jgi:hypothetical protein
MASSISWDAAETATKSSRLVPVPCSPSASGYYRMMLGANLFLAEIAPDRAGGEFSVRQREVFSIR